VIGGILTTGQPLGEVIRRLAVSKQTAGQMVDVLVLRGYVERSVDPTDRRRLVLALSERGEAAAEIIREVVEATEQRLAAEVGPSAIEQTRRTLAALVGGPHG
jgi:DNA-binding MarR family transcriptional regulator